MTSIHGEGEAPPPGDEDPSLVDPNRSLEPIEPSEEPLVPSPDDDLEEEAEGIQGHNPWIARGGIAFAVLFLAGAGYVVLNRGGNNPPPAPAFAMPASQPAPLPPSVSYPDPSQQGQPPVQASPASQTLPAEPERPVAAAPAQGPAPVPAPQAPTTEPVKATLEPAVVQTLQADLSALKDRVATLEQRQKSEPKVVPVQRPVSTVKRERDEKPKAATSTPKDSGQRLNAQLQAVVPGQAWVNLNGAVHVVHVGDALPGAGVVQKIDTESFRVTTTTGVIE